MAVVTRRVELRSSNNDYDWLGHGIYYWEDDPKRALDWAIRCAKAGTHPISDPAVVGAVIDLADCLNLIQTEAYALVEEAYRILKTNCETAGEPVPINCGFVEAARYLDCSVFETLHDDQGKIPFASIRAFFPEGEPVFPGAGIRQRDHIQICVRHPGRILGHFLPSQGS